MSTLPAASSFSGSADSVGTTGRTSRPTVAKSPCAIAVYNGAWSALGNQSSITENGFVAGAERASCLEPHAASASRQGRASSSARARWIHLPPGGKQDRGLGRGAMDLNTRRGFDGALNGLLLLAFAPTARARARPWPG